MGVYRRLAISAAALFFCVPAMPNPVPGASKNEATDSSHEHSHEKSSTRKQSRDRKTSSDVQTKINVNALLIQRFVKDYEVRGTGSSWAAKYFGSCEPFTGIDTQFPVLSLGPSAVIATTRAAGTRDLPRIFQLEAWWAQSKTGGGSKIGFFRHDIAPPAHVLRDSTGPVGEYIQCRIAAHFAITAAAEELQREQSTRRFSSRAEVATAIDKIYSDYIAQDSVRTMISSATHRVQSTLQSCAPFLKFITDSESGHDMSCGVFAISNNSITVDGIPTLSPDAINGERYEIALSSSSSSSSASEVAAKSSTSSKSSRKTSSAIVAAPEVGSTSAERFKH